MWTQSNYTKLLSAMKKKNSLQMDISIFFARSATRQAVKLNSIELSKLNNILQLEWTLWYLTLLLFTAKNVERGV